MKRNLGIAAVLTAALVAVEHFGLERTAEKRQEDRYARIADLPASSVLPSYLASLFLGSFRVVVIDALWIEASRMREEEHRYFETIEIMNFISVLQPRNPEVWAQQAQDAGWNIANPTRDPERKWEWIRFAARTLDRGIRHLPDNPYLKHEMAWLLVYKPAWRDGVLDRWFLERVEGDAELQEMWGGGRAPSPPRTSFEIAADYLRLAAEDLGRLGERGGWRYYTTQSGRNIHLSTLEGYRRLALSYQGHYLWLQGRHREASGRFREAAGLAASIRETHGLPIYSQYEELDRGCAEIMDLLDRTGGRQDAALLERMEELLLRTRRADYDHLRSRAAELKQRLGGDGFEWNDDYDRSTELRPDALLGCNLAGGRDTDVFSIRLPDPGEGRTFVRRTVKIGVANLSGLPLSVILVRMTDAGPAEEGPHEIPPGERRILDLAVDRPGYSFAKVAAAAPVPDGAVPEYRIGWAGID